MVNLAQKYFSQPIINIPYAYALENTRTTKNTFNFIIPGVVSKSRRDYKTVLDGFSSLPSEYNLVLLGKNVDGLPRQPNIITFKDYVPTDVYNSYLQDADFLVFPTYFFVHTVNTADEFYGFTKSTNIHEAVKWRKPIIVPDHFPIDPRLMSSTLKYEDADDLAFHMSVGLRDKKALTKEAYKNTKHFTLDKIKKYVNKVLN